LLDSADASSSADLGQSDGYFVWSALFIALEFIGCFFFSIKIHASKANHHLYLCLSGSFIRAAKFDKKEYSDIAAALIIFMSSSLSAACTKRTLFHHLVATAIPFMLLQPARLLLDIFAPK
jgi:hypothetical protein